MSDNTRDIISRLFEAVFLLGFLALALPSIPSGPEVGHFAPMGIPALLLFVAARYIRHRGDPWWIAFIVLETAGAGAFLYLNYKISEILLNTVR